MVLAGIVLALASLWYGLITGIPNRQGLPVPLGDPALADVTLKLAAVLVLGGLVITLLTHDVTTVSNIPPEHPRNVPPSV
jgi:hypothetical protein